MRSTRSPAAANAAADDAATTQMVSATESVVASGGENREDVAVVEQDSDQAADAVVVAESDAGAGEQGGVVEAAAPEGGSADAAPAASDGQVTAAPEQTAEADQADEASQAAKADELATYLASANAAFKRNRLTTPADDNVYYWSRKVLAIEPKNAEAVRLMHRTINKYLRWATAHYQADRIDKARSLLRRAQKLKAYAGRKQRRMMTALDEKIRTWQPASVVPAMAAKPKEPDSAWEKLTDWLSSEPSPQVNSNEDDGAFSY